MLPRTSYLKELHFPSLRYGTFKCFILTEDSVVDPCDAVITCAVVDVDVVCDDGPDVKLFGKYDFSFI